MNSRHGHSPSSTRREVVVTGYGFVLPLGLDGSQLWKAITERRSGIGPITSFDASHLPVHWAGEVRNFDPKLYVKPRKSLKVMSRDMQFGVTAAQFAREHARLDEGSVDPERMGVVFGGDRICTPIEECLDGYRASTENGEFSYDLWVKNSTQAYPLWMLKSLPNMIASHVSIVLDARNHNNTIHQSEVSGLLAIGDAARRIEGGWADVMFAGGSSSLMDPYDWTHGLIVEEFSQRNGSQITAPRPFDADRDGQVRGEGCAVLVLESREHAEARRANILATLSGLGAAGEAWRPGQQVTGAGLQRAIEMGLRDAGIDPQDVGHVNAHGMGTLQDDRVEAEALHAVLPDIPVTAPKSYMGNLNAASGVAEAVFSLMAFENGAVPPTINHDRCAADCPVDVIAGDVREGLPPVAVVVNQTRLGQAACIVLSKDA